MAIPPAVKVTTAAGAAVPGVTVTFAVASGGGSVTGATPTTGADGVATVGSWTLGPLAEPNTLTATVAGSGIAGNPATFAATGLLAAFDPVSNTNLAGIHAFASVNIRAGVTVTMTGNLTLNVTGATTIVGNIVGDCVNLTINAEGALTVSGNLDNGCTGPIPATGPPVMTLVGKGGYTLNGPGSFTAGGDVTITNDPTLTDANFGPSSGAPAPVPGSDLQVNGGVSSVGEPCINNGFNGTAKPATAKNGADGGATGANGADGATWTLRCKGGSDIVITGSLTLTGQHGGKGGNGTHASATAAVSSGGDGGKGGAIRIQALGSISLGPGTWIKTGNGGVGGGATADGSSGHGGNVGASAAATGGAGGSPGLFTAVAKTGSIAFGASSFLEIGTGGRGGDASAIGGDGHDALPCPAAVGGAATATAGAGGSTPDKTLTAAGAVTGSGNVTVIGGTPGAGGNATANAGKGGAGAQPCKPGAIGGAPTAKGGKGGNADLKNQSGTKVANGGNGGSMEVKNGNGGQGWIDCDLPTFEAGGVGGMGGSIAGFNGAFGTGFADGTAGAAAYTTVANGGNGGDGLPPGTGGNPGGNGVVLNGGVAPAIVAPSFQAGLPGVACAGISLVVSPSSQTLVQGGQGSVSIIITRTGSFTGAVTVQIKDQGGTVRGSGSIPAGNTSTGVTFTVPANEPDGLRTWTATVSGPGGVPTATKDIELIVTGPGGLVNVTFQNKEQATNPWTVVLLKVGSGADQSLPIASDGTVTAPVPGAATPVRVVIQQEVGIDRRTENFELGSLDFVRFFAGFIGGFVKAPITTTVSGTSPNAVGNSWAGSQVEDWIQPNTAPFAVQLPAVETGFDLVGGCALFGPTGEPESAILGLVNYMSGGSYSCNFGGPGVKSYGTYPTTVTGVSPGPSLRISGGFQLDRIQTPVYSKPFGATTTTNYRALMGGDLPPGVKQFETVARSTTSSYEATTYYFTNPLAWSTPLPPSLSTPTVSINSIFNSYYEFNIVQPVQLVYLSAWVANYRQANTFGGVNEVRHLTLRSFLPSGVLSTVTMRTPISMLLNQAFMPKPGAGMVSGDVGAYGYHPLTLPVVNSVRNEAFRVNLSF